MADRFSQCCQIGPEYPQKSPIWHFWPIFGKKKIWNIWGLCKNRTPNFQKAGYMCLQFRRRSQLFQNSFKLYQTSHNASKPYPTGPNLSQPILIHPNPVQTYQTPHHAEVPNSGKILVYCSQIIEKNWKNVDLR